MVADKRPTIKKRKSFTRWIKRMTAPRVSPMPSGPETDKKHGVFGTPLIVSISYARATIGYQDENQVNHQRAAAVPLVVAKCGAYLKRHGLETEGCFRLQGSMKRVNHLQQVFDSPSCSYGLHHSWQGYTVHDVGNVLRRFLLQLPDPVIPFDFYKSFRDVMNDKNYDDTEQRIDAFQALIRRLPTPHQHLLLYMLDMLRIFAMNASVTRMDAANLATVFSPGLLHHPAHNTPIHYKIAQRVIEFLIEFQPVFTMDLLVDNDASKAVDPEESLFAPGVQSPTGSLKSMLKQPATVLAGRNRSSSSASSRKSPPPVPTLPAEWLTHNNNTVTNVSASRSSPTPSQLAVPAPQQTASTSAPRSPSPLAPVSPPMSPAPTSAASTSPQKKLPYLLHKAMPFLPPTPQSSITSSPDTSTNAAQKKLLQRQQSLSRSPTLQHHTTILQNDENHENDDDDDDCPTPRPGSPIVTSPTSLSSSPTSYQPAVTPWQRTRQQWSTFFYYASQFSTEPIRAFWYISLSTLLLATFYEGYMLYSYAWRVEPYVYFIGMGLYMYLLLAGVHLSDLDTTATPQLGMDDKNDDVPVQMYRVNDGFITDDDDDDDEHDNTDRYSQRACDGDGLSLFDDVSMLDQHKDEEKLMADQQVMENWQHLLTRSWRAPPDILEEMARQHQLDDKKQQQPSQSQPQPQMQQNAMKNGTAEVIEPRSPQQVFPALGHESFANNSVDDDLMSVASSVSRFDDGFYGVDEDDDDDDDEEDEDEIASLADTELEMLWLRYQQSKLNSDDIMST